MDKDNSKNFNENDADRLLNAITFRVKLIENTILGIKSMVQIDHCDVGSTEERRIEKAKIEGYNEAIRAVADKFKEN